MQGHVFNAHYLAYFDLTLTELWRAAIGHYALMTERGVDLVVAEAGVRYLAAARFDDEIEVEAAIERLGSTAMTTRFRVLRGSDLLVDAWMRHVCVDAAALTKTPIPDWLRSALSPWLVAAPADSAPADSAPAEPAPARSGPA
jgi:acyl-CoA thioester hydrolase